LLDNFLKGRIVILSRGLDRIKLSKRWLFQIQMILT
jgi:hypothetical protein